MLKVTILRRNAQLSKAELARRAKLDQGLVSKIESERVRPYPKELARLAKALGVARADAEHLLEHVDSPEQL